MRKPLSPIIFVSLIIVGLTVWLGTVFPHNESLAAPVDTATTMKQLIAENELSTGLKSQEYLIILEIHPDGSSLESQVSNRMAFLFPELSSFQEQGQIESFSPVSELGAIVLEMPTVEVLNQALTWPGVREVVPVEPQQMQRVMGQAEVVRQEVVQAQAAMQKAAEREAMERHISVNMDMALQPLAANATFNVLNTNDVVDVNPGDGVCETAVGNGVCTLRAAIQEANALPGADVINVAAGTYVLGIGGGGEDAAATGDLDITDDLTIYGDPSVTTAVNGSGSYIGDRVFHIVTGTVNINYLDISNGYSYPPDGDYGGGLLVNAGTTLNLNYSTVRNSSAVFGGGGISTNGNLSIFNSTISGNYASDGDGGGILVNGSGTANLDSVTLYDNSAYRTGGVNGIFSARNSIIAGNSVSTGSSLDCGGTLNSQGYNLVQDTTGCTIAGVTTGNILGMTPQLSWLQDNGGAAYTHALLTGSPAIDAGDNSNCPATDQRGVIRPVDGDGNGVAACDMGAYEYVYSVDLNSLYVDVNETYLYGYISEPNASMTLTLKSGASIKSQIQTVADGTQFRGYFTQVIEGGDTIEIKFPGVPVKVIAVPNLSLAVDKATDIVSGTALADKQVYVYAYSYHRDSHYEYTTADSNGNFNADISGQFDIFIGDEVDIRVSDDNNYRFRINDVRVKGLSVDPVYDSASGYADPGVAVNLTLKDSDGVVKATAVDQSDYEGWFWVSFPGAVDIIPGDSVTMQYGSQPAVTVQVVSASVNTIDPATETVTGTSPANAKMEVYTWDNYTTEYATLVTNASASGQYSVDFNGIVDILLGSYTYVTYHDAQDNEVSAGRLYVGPYVRASVSNWTDLYVAGQPNEVIDAVLRNSLGAIKATANGVADPSGYAYLEFYDSANSSVDIIAGDTVEVNYGSGATRTVDVVSIDYITDRDALTVTGTGPANGDLRLIYNTYTEADVTIGGSGYFSHTFSYLTAGRSMKALYRNPQGNDVEVYGYVPVFTVNPDNHYVNGYGPVNAAVVANLKDSNGIAKATVSTTTDRRGYYWLNLSSTIVVSDTVVIDVGPLHYEQVIVPLSIAADTVNNIVYGTAPANGWLNIYDQNYFGPYDSYNHDYFYADNLGNFSASFGEVRGGDYLRVMYWEGNGGGEDQVEIYRYAPYVQIDHTADAVYGTTTSGAVGTITVRNSGGAVKASATVMGSVPYGSISFLPDVDIVPGDQVETHVGVLNQTDPVIPMSGSLNLGTDKVSGVSLPSINLGVEAYAWRNTYYSEYTDNGTMSGFAPTNSSGAFSMDYSGITDLTSGSYTRLFYYDGDETRYQASFYTTNPTMSVDSYPTAVLPAAPVEVQFTLANGVHAHGTSVRWDTQSHAADNNYVNYSTWLQGVIGQNVQSFRAPTGGTIFFKVVANVDGQALWSDEQTIVVSGSDATTLYDPVSGTTNDNTPAISGLTVPNAAVMLYQNGVQIGTKTANANGEFTFVTPVLAAGSYQFHAASKVGAVVGPDSNIVNLTVDPTLYVDPVHILLTTRGQTQHLRDESGYANLGGQIWTRTGDSVAISIPISYTNIYTADLYVGAIYETSLLDSGNDIYVGTYTPPSSGNYAVSLKFRGDGPAGPIHTVDILTGLIDPDGYVYDADLGLDHRISGAVVTCYELVEESPPAWLSWNGAIWDQINPQTTVADGYYAFFTLPGKYKVKVSAPGYVDYESPVLTVVDEPVHHNVPLLTAKYVYLPMIMR